MPETPPSDAPDNGPDPTPPPPTPQPPQPDPPPSDTTDWRAKFEDTLRESRKHEERAKANANAAKELEKLRQQTMTEQEKAVAAARDEGRRAALVEFGVQLVDAEVRAVSAGRLDDKAVHVLLQGLNRQAFLNEDGTVDTKSVREFVDGIAPKPPEEAPPGFPDLGQGARSGNLALNGDPLLRDLKSKLGIA